MATSTLPQTNSCFDCSELLTAANSCESCGEHVHAEGDEEGAALHGCHNGYHKVECDDCSYSFCDSSC